MFSQKNKLVFLSLMFAIACFFTTTLAVELPALKAHNLPSNLAQWQDRNNSGDYFDQIKPSPMGYLVLSKYPIKVYVDNLGTSLTISSELKRIQDWKNNVEQAIKEWNIYLPLVLVTQPEIADIKISRSHPPAPPISFNREQKEFQIPRARSAQTRYEFYINQSEGKNILAHRFNIDLSPDLSPEYTKAAARHELGHALGIWGHSTLQTDTMYFSQVRNPPPISARDINTLKRIYQQPTRLGWAI